MPIVHLWTGVLPVTGLGPELVLRLVPFLVVHQLLVLLLGDGPSAWREQLLRLALFPAGIRACASAARGACAGHAPHVPSTAGGVGRHVLRPQLLVALLLAAALAAGAVRLVTEPTEPAGTLVAGGWAVLHLAALGALVTAARAAGRVPRRRSTDALHH